MKYAIVENGGKQYKAFPGGTIEVDRLPLPVGEKYELNRVLLIADDDQITVGQPTVSGAKVVATVLEHFKAPKIIVFKYKPRQRYRVKRGHRQQYTRLHVEDIVIAKPAKKASEKAAKEKPAAAKTEKAAKPASKKKATEAKPAERKKTTKKATSAKATTSKSSQKSSKAAATKSAAKRTTSSTKSKSARSSSKAETKSAASRKKSTSQESKEKKSGSGKAKQSKKKSAE
jgi:large subunit ribosomal protein L21